MDTLQKLHVSGQHMALEPAEEAEAVSRPTGVVDAHQVAACGQTPAALQQKIALGIQSAVLPGGKRLPLLKTLLTSACERDFLLQGGGCLPAGSDLVGIRDASRTRYSIGFLGRFQGHVLA